MDHDPKLRAMLAAGSGPAHIVRQEMDRAEADMRPLFTLWPGDVKIRLASDPPSLVNWQLRRALRMRQDMVADRLLLSSERPADVCAIPIPKSKVANAPFANVPATGALWTRGECSSAATCAPCAA